MAPRSTAALLSRLTLVRVVASACLLLAACPAWAGHYTGPTYSGGSVTYSPPGVTLPYGLLNGQYGGGLSGNTSVVCQGTVTATFVWVPDNGDAADVPPDNVVVQEWRDAWGQGLFTASGLDQGDSPPVDRPSHPEWSYCWQFAWVQIL